METNKTHALVGIIDPTGLDNERHFRDFRILFTSSGDSVTIEEQEGDSIDGWITIATMIKPRAEAREYARKMKARHPGLSWR